MDTIIVDFQIVNAVNASWNRIIRIPNYEQIAGELLFRKIFALAPAALSMFPFAEDFREREEEMYQSEAFQRHAKGVVGMLDAAVNMMGPDLEPATNALIDLGGRHVAYGVLPVHYEVVGKALIHTLSTVLGERWTPPVEEGWIAVYGFISTAMIDGANRQMAKAQARRERLRKKISKVRHEERRNPDPETVVEHVSSLVEQLRLIPELSKTSSSQHASAWRDRKQISSLLDGALNISISSAGSDSTECADPDDDDSYYGLVIEKVFRSWERVKSIPDYERFVGVLLFKKVFEIAPGAKALYSFYDAKDPGMQGDYFYAHPFLIRHAVAFIQTLDVAVNMLGPDWDPVTDVLKELGARHVQHGVTADHYTIVGEALLSTLEAVLGDDWTEEGAKLGWTTIFSFVSSTMIKGANAAATKTEA